MALQKKQCLNRSFYNESNVFSRERLPWKPPDVQRNGGVGARRTQHHPRLTVQLSMEGGEEQVGIVIIMAGQILSLKSP